MYKGVSGWEGRVGGFSKPETQPLRARKPAQELTETATVGLDHGKGRGGRRGTIGTSMPPY